MCILKRAQMKSFSVTTTVEILSDENYDSKI